MSLLDDDFLYDEGDKRSKLDKLTKTITNDIDLDDLDDLEEGIFNYKKENNRYKSRNKVPDYDKISDNRVENLPTKVKTRAESSSGSKGKENKQLDLSEKVIKKMENAFGIKFSEEQLDIIKHKGAPLNVLSGAGSGKTTILVAKMLYREMVDDVKPINMLAITFTSDARHEMEERYLDLRGKLNLERKTLPTFRTFHALFLMLLQTMKGFSDYKVLEFNKYRNQLSNMVVATEDTEKSKVLEEMFSYKGNLINKGLSVDGVENAEHHFDKSYNFKIDNYISVMKKYKELKESDGYIDFDDMQVIIYKEIIENGNKEPVKAFRRVWGDGDVYIDEYQDISKIQRTIMDALIKDFNRFTVIGDDDQSIYSWRGSDPSFIIDFPYHYENAYRLNLTVNYRCKENILKPVLSSIAKNKRRVDKDIKAFNKGGYVELLPIEDSYEPLLDTLEDEVDGYVGEMYKDIAILVRQNSQRTLIADGLVSRGIPVNIVHENNSLQKNTFYVTIMEVIRMIKERDNELFVKHARKILPQMSKSLIEKYKYKDESWYYEICVQRLYNVREEVEIIEKINKTNNMYNAVVLTWKLLKDYYKQITSKGYGSYTRITEIVKYMINTAKGVSIDEYRKNENRKASRLRLWIGSEEAIKIDTLHSVKGLEFDIVYIIGVDGNIIPNMNRYKDYIKEGKRDIAEQYIEEERRLFYVGWTRAKERLVVSYNKNNPSIFLREIDKSFFDKN